MEHAWLNKQLVRQAEESACLTAISTAVSGALNVPELLDLALERLIALIGMEGGAALLIDDATQCLTLAAERNLPPAAKDWLEQHPIPVGEFIPGLTAQRCEMFVVKNAKDDERELPLLREMGVGTHICIPLAVSGQALGVFGMTDAERRSFSCSELNLFTASGELLGAGVERARLFESKAMLAGRLQTLNELMRIAVSTLDINEAFTRIELQVRQLIDLDRFSIALRPAGKDHLEMYAVALESQRTFATGTPSRFQTLETPMGEVTLTGRPLIRRNPADFTYPLEFEMEQAGGIVRQCSFL